MRTSVVILPAALEHGALPNLFPSADAVIDTLARHGKHFVVEVVGGAIPELEWIGLKSDSPYVAEGVFAVSAFGADPPESSVQLCLTLMSTDGKASRPATFAPDNEVLQEIWKRSLCLETSRLKLVKGVGVDHGLVWEDGSIDLKCFTPEELTHCGLSQALPEGDGESMLRRLIDDSINLLSELEVNRIRQEEGVEVLNLLWPWGPGFRPGLPNLTIERGMSVQIESPSIRLKGLSRLVGYRHGDPWSLGTGTNLKLERIAESLQKAPMGLAVIPTIGEFRRKEKHEEASWLGHEVLSRLVKPLLSLKEEERIRILLIATQASGDGLAIDFRSDAIRENREIPFSAEALEERSLPKKKLGPLIAEALTAQ